MASVPRKDGQRRGPVGFRMFGRKCKAPILQLALAKATHCGNKALRFNAAHSKGEDGPGCSVRAIFTAWPGGKPAFWKTTLPDLVNNAFCPEVDHDIYRSYMICNFDACFLSPTPVRVMGKLSSPILRLARRNRSLNSASIESPRRVACCNMRRENNLPRQPAMNMT